MMKTLGVIARIAALFALLSAATIAQADFCWRDSYGRSVGKIPTNCGAGKQYDAGLCYGNCKSNYKGVGPVCWGSCPSGWTDHGVGCTKPAPYGRGAGYPWKFGDGLNDNGMYKRCRADNPAGCEKDGAIVYPKCKPGYHKVGCCICSPDCPSGFGDTGATCTKPTYGRGAGTVPKACDGGKQYDAGLCYNNCKSGYSGVGPVCWGQCPANMPVNCGAGCATTKEDCSGAVRDQVMSVVEVAVTIVTTVATAGAATGAEAGAAAAETGAKAATKAAANQATKAAAKGITKAAAKAALIDAAKGAGANLSMQQIDQVAGVAAGDDWDPYSLDPTGIAAVVKAYNHKVCKG